MRMTGLHVSHDPRYALGRLADTNEPVLSIPVSNTLADYEEYYRISEDELRLFLDHPEVAAAFARCCGRREADARLALKPGTDRGHYCG